jgi:hypothetical protein
MRLYPYILIFHKLISDGLNRKLDIVFTPPPSCFIFYKIRNILTDVVYFKISFAAQNIRIVYEVSPGLFSAQMFRRLHVSVSDGKKVKLSM